MKKNLVLRILSVLTLILLTGCKQSGDSFGFVEDTFPSENENQGAPAITSASPTGTATICVSPLASPMCGSQSSPPLTSSASATFSVSVTGAAPITYVWKLNGTPLSGANSSNYTFISDPTTVPAGNYTLSVTATNAEGSDTESFSVKVNQPPILTVSSPSNSSISKVRFNTVANYDVAGSDANGDAISYTWKVDGVTSATLGGSAISGGSRGTYSPALTNVGQRTLTVTATDSSGGYEPSSVSWTVNVNSFSTTCNQLLPGQICTIVGNAGVGNGKTPATQNSEIFIRPEYITADSAGDLFFSDSINHVVWFYNRDLDSGSDTKRVVGVDVPAGQIRIVMGNGADGNSGDSGTCGVAPCAISKFKLDLPYGVAWDEARQALFVADSANHRIVWGKQDGTVEWVACTKTTVNTAASNGGGLAKTQGCSTPIGISYDSANQILYVAAYNLHAIKAFNVSNPDPANWTGETVVGGDNNAGVIQAFGTNAAPYGDGATGLGKGIHYCVSGCGTKAMARYPRDVAIGSDGVVFFLSNLDCRIRAINRTGLAKTYFNGAVNVPNNQVVALSGAWNVCANTTAGNYSSARYRNPLGLAVYESAGVKGWFITGYDHNRVYFLNNSGVTTQTFGDQAVSPLQMETVFGTGTASYNGVLNSGKLTELFYPRGLVVTNGQLVVTDYQNYRVRSLDISQSNGPVSDLVGESAKSGFDGLTSVAATSAILNDPRYIAYDSSNDAIYFTDSGNDRIRKVDLLSGIVSTFIGATGSGSNHGEADGNDVIPSMISGFFMRGLKMMGAALLFHDTENASAVNSNCVLRAYNPGSSAAVILNTSVSAGKVRTVAGSWVNGCTAGTWLGSGGAATSATFRRNMEDIVYDGADIFLTNYEESCVQKISGTTGIITSYLGLCGTAGDQDQTIASGGVRFTNPKGMYQDPRYPSNFFVVDFAASPTSYLKYVNKTASNIDIGGVTAAANSVTKLISIGGYGNAVAAKDNQVCYSSGYQYNGSAGSHNVICYNRDDALGAITLRAGPADNTTRGGSQQGTEAEGISASNSSVLLYAPHGIEFDGEGNLWITEQGSSVIRMVKKWW